MGVRHKYFKIQELFLFIDLLGKTWDLERHKISVYVQYQNSSDLLRPHRKKRLHQFLCLFQHGLIPGDIEKNLKQSNFSLENVKSVGYNTTLWVVPFTFFKA